jgi:hypothetical protein
MAMSSRNQITKWAPPVKNIRARTTPRAMESTTRRRDNGRPGLNRKYSASGA